MKWRPKDVVAVIFAASVPIIMLSALALKFFGDGMTSQGLSTLKEIMLVITGGLIMWLGGESRTTQSE